MKLPMLIGAIITTSTAMILGVTAATMVVIIDVMTTIMMARQSRSGAIYRDLARIDGDAFTISGSN